MFDLDICMLVPLTLFDIICVKFEGQGHRS